MTSPLARSLATALAALVGLSPLVACGAAPLQHTVEDGDDPAAPASDAGHALVDDDVVESEDAGPRALPFTTFSFLPGGQRTDEGPFLVEPGTQLVVTTTGGGDPDLYVRFDAPVPTDLSSFDCRSTGWSAEERCELLVPEGASTVWIATVAYGQELAIFTLSVTTSDPAVPDDDAGTPVTEELTGTVLPKARALFGPFPVVPGTDVVATMTGTGEPQLLVAFGLQPDIFGPVDCRPDDVTNARCDLVVPAGQTELYVTIYGSSFPGAALEHTFEVSLSYVRP